MLVPMLFYYKNKKNQLKYKSKVVNKNWGKKCNMHGILRNIRSVLIIKKTGEKSFFLKLNLKGLKRF